MEQSSYEGKRPKEVDLLIIDPTSPEVNRGSFCYLPYILYNHFLLEFERSDKMVWLEENFTMADIDNLPKYKECIVALWSYPQMDICIMMNKFLPKTPKFFGYYPLIEALKFNQFKVKNEMIVNGIFYYPYAYQYFKYLTLSDCDMHLRKYSGKVYPMFTSYGCPRGCAFCPSTVNTGGKRLILEISQVEMMLTRCKYFGYHNIHFTDENFFFDTNRAYTILEIASLMGGFNFIALGEVATVNRFISKYGTDILHRAGMRLIEIGLETADENLGMEMGKSPVARCKELAEKCDVPIFWLTMTFFPGETLKTLNTTGEFLRKYGFKLEELQGRVQTNGTEGGLGQFFQVYHGTKIQEVWKELGIIVNNRPMRLHPSFIPMSFLKSKIYPKRGLTSSDIKWFDLYKIEIDKIWGLAELLPKKRGKTMVDAFHEDMKRFHMMMEDLAIFYAICARLSII